MGDDKLSVVEVKNEAERRDRSGGTNPVPTVESFAKRFLDDYCRAERHKPSGIAAKETILRLHVLPRWGEKRLNSITTQDVQRLKADLAGKSGKTLNNVLTVVGKMLKVAVEWDIIERVPCKIRLVKVSIPSTSFYDFQQFDRLIPEAKKEPLELLVDLLGAEAGLRCGEMRGLQWRDVDFSNRTLCVERSIWQDQVTATKGWRLRHIPLTTRLLNALSLYPRRRSPWVLCRADGRFLTKKQIQKIARRPASRCGLPAGVHVLRHTFCSHLAMRGVPPFVIRELAGHSDLSTTMRYVHLSRGAKEDAIRLLNERVAASDQTA